MNKAFKVIMSSALWLCSATSVVAMTYCMPTESRKVNSSFGARWGRQHKGLDIKVQMGDTIRAAFDGEIVKSEFNSSGYGNYVVIAHDKKTETLYAHLSKCLVKAGTHVVAGQPIGLGGRSGRATGVHLHFEVHIDGKAINPSKMFDFEHQCLKVVDKSEKNQVAHDKKKHVAEENRQHVAQQKKDNGTSVEQPDTLASHKNDEVLLAASDHESRVAALPLASMTMMILKLATEKGSPKLLPLSALDYPRPDILPGVSDVKFDSPLVTPHVVIEIIQPPPEPPKWSTGNCYL